MEKHPDWMWLKIRGRKYIVMPEFEHLLARKLFEAYPADVMVTVIDFDTREVIDEQPLNVLYNDN